MAYHLPPAQIYLTKSWLKETNLDLVETVKRMIIPRKNFWTRPPGEYDTATLWTPYRFIALMLNMIFGRAHGKSFKLGWMPIIFYVAIQGTIFNWENIVSNSLSACISSALGGVSQKKLRFYMSSILVDCILCTYCSCNLFPKFFKFWTLLLILSCLELFGFLNSVFPLLQFWIFEVGLRWTVFLHFGSWMI